ncbi:hypothetical protein BGX38DRAFT_619968 [Terfezia claveryi]|nr:hypothetical protein BGX38DRAFT_619968 [Terfezia claveryi]
MGGDNRNTVREAAMRHKILITPPTTPQTDTGTQTTPDEEVLQVDTSTQNTAPTTPGTDTSSQTILPVSTNTDTPPVRTYAEAATSTTSLPSGAGKGKGKEERKTQTPPPTHYKPSAPRKITTRDRVPQHAGFITTPPPNRSRAIVFHAAPMKYKPGLMRRWIEEDNEGARIVGIRWLLQEGRRVGKLASSLVIYLAAEIDTTHGLRMGKRVFRTTNYEWNRGL